MHMIQWILARSIFVAPSKVWQALYVVLLEIAHMASRGTTSGSPKVGLVQCEGISGNRHWIWSQTHVGWQADLVQGLVDLMEDCGTPDRVCPVLHDAEPVITKYHSGCSSPCTIATTVFSCWSIVPPNLLMYVYQCCPS